MRWHTSWSDKGRVRRADRKLLFCVGGGCRALGADGEDIDQPVRTSAGKSRVVSSIRDRPQSGLLRRRNLVVRKDIIQRTNGPWTPPRAGTGGNAAAGKRRRAAAIYKRGCFDAHSTAQPSRGGGAVEEPFGGVSKAHVPDREGGYSTCNFRHKV